MLGNWLDIESRNLTPLELTLRLWAACAGDWQGAELINALAFHVRRLAPASSPSRCPGGAGNAGSADGSAHL